jgi:hypothetical protein
MRMTDIATMASAATLFAAALALGGCISEGMEACFVKIIPDWSEHTEWIDPPSSYTVRVGDYTATADTPSHTVERLFATGTYPLYVYNEAEHITIDGTTVSVAPDPASASAHTRQNAAFIRNDPWWLFTCAMEITIDGGRQEVIAPMRQQVRQLTFILELTGEGLHDVSGITGTLSGVATTLDMRTQTHGTPSDIALVFTRITSGEHAGKWSATVRLLGVTVTEHTLQALIRFDGAGREAMAVDSDLTEELDGFNTGKVIPLTLEGEISVDANEAALTGTIEDWTPNYGGTITAQ